MKPVRTLCLLFLASLAPAWAQPAGPAIDLRLNAHAPAEKPLSLARGEPLIAAVSLRQPDDQAGNPLVLDPPAGGWSSRVKLVVTDPAGAVVPLAFAPTGKPSGGALALQPGAISTLVLRWTGDPATAPAGGHYQMVARLELADGRGWRGVVTSAPLRFDLVEAAAMPTGDALGRRQLLRVHDAILAGELGRADAIARELWEADRTRPEGWLAMALVAEASGEATVALTFVDTAIARTLRVEDGQAESGKTPVAQNRVPFEYIDLRRRIERMGAPP